MSTFWEKLLRRYERIDQRELAAQFQRLSREEDLLRAILQSMSEAIVVLDARQRIVFVNEAGLELLGIAGRRSLNKPLLRYLTDPGLAEALNGRGGDAELSATSEIEIAHPRRMVLAVRMVPYRVDGSPKGRLIILRDVTAERRRQQEQLQSEKLDAMHTLAAGVAHEIGNPLNSLGIHLQLMGREIERLPKGKRRERLGHLAKVSTGEVQRLDDILRQFLGAARPSKMHLRKGRLHAVLEQLLEFLYYEMERNHIAVEKAYDPAVPEVLMDEAQIRQAFFNIIKNAIQAMPNGGVLRVSTRVSEGEISVVFRDSGVGIPKERMARIFDPFYTTKKQGSGLGLMIVYKIVKDHDGRIEVASEEGKGTTVTVHLPVTERRVRLLTDQREQQEAAFGVA